MVKDAAVAGRERPQRRCEPRLRSDTTEKINSKWSAAVVALADPARGADAFWPPRRPAWSNGCLTLGIVDRAGRTLGYDRIRRCSNEVPATPAECVAGANTSLR